MLKNYFKVALRYLGKHKGYTVINVFGLAMGIACCILVMLFVRSEWSYDRFHSKNDRLYRAWLVELYEGERFENSVTPLPLGPALTAHIPDIESTTRVYAGNTIVRYGNASFKERFHMVDSTFFQLFDFKLKEGSAEKALLAKTSIIITERIAKKYFGNEVAVGKNLEITMGDEQILFTVAGIADNPPLESSVQFEILLPFTNAVHLFSEKQRTSAWSQVFVETYALLKKESTFEGASARLPGMVKQIAGDKYKEGSYNLYLQPITDIHLNNAIPEGIEPVSDPKYSYILSTIGLLILLIACINFVTLSVGRSVTRALEVGVRKVLGAQRSQLIRQFWGEAFILTVLSFVIGIIVAIVLLNPFNQIANRELHLQFDVFTVMYCLGIMVLVALISGIYPALVLSGFAPMEVLKGKLKSGPSIGLFRKSLIVGQFVASIIMIIGTIAVGRQLHYLKSKNLGYNKEQIVIIPMNKGRAEGYPLADRFQQELSRNPDVINASTSIYTFAEPGWVNLGYNDDKNNFRQFRMNAVDENFLTTMGLELVAGRNFSKENPADISSSMLINEALAKEYNWANPIGQKLPGEYQFQVIGVVKDFHFESLHNAIKPVAMVLKPDSMFSWSSDVSIPFDFGPRVSVRLRAGDLQKQVEMLKNAWTKVAGDQGFEFRFLDDALNTAYQQEQRLAKIVQYASVVSIIIACMGLFGLATLMVVRRTREIGIRKVLGAEINSIVLLVSKDFVVLVALSSLIAFPIAWWALNKWMEDFEYRTNLPVWIFALAAFIALMIAVITVSFQAVRAALMNPVKSLRTE